MAIKICKDGQKWKYYVTDQLDMQYVPTASEAYLFNGETDTFEKVPSAEDLVEPTGEYQEKTVTPSASSQTVVADSGYDALSKVIVNGDTNLLAGNIKSGVSIFGVSGSLVQGQDTSDANITAEDVLTGKVGYGADGKVTGTMPNNSATETVLDSATTSYTIPAGKHSGTGTVKIETETKTITPSTSEQTEQASSGKVISSVTVNAVTSDIDSNISAENIKKDVTILGVTGTLEQGIDTADATATAGDILDTKTAYVNGQKITGTIPFIEVEDQILDASNTSYQIPNGYHSGLTTVSVVLETKQVNPSTESQNIIANTGKLISQITVSPVTAAIDSNIVAGNIKDGVTILGVEGTLVEGTDTSDATATASQIVSGATAYVNGSKITGTLVPLDTSDADATAANIDSGKTAYVNGVKITGTSTKIDTSSANAVATDILSGKTAYVNGSLVTGSITSKEAQTYTPSSSEQTIAAGQYLSGAQTIAAVPTEEKSATPSATQQEITPTEGKFLSKVTVAGDVNLTAENIKSGITIFGIVGTYTGESA